jgi:hypothetical protein
MVPLREQVKAVLSGVVAGLGTLGTALADGAVSPAEWVAVALAAVLAYGVVYRVGQEPQAVRLVYERDRAQASADAWRQEALLRERNRADAVAKLRGTVG